MEITDNLTLEMKSYMNRDKYLTMEPRHRRIYRCKINELISELSRIDIKETCGCITNKPMRSYDKPSYTSKFCDEHMKEFRYNLWLYEKMRDMDDHIYEIRKRYYVKFVKRSNGMDKILGIVTNNRFERKGICICEKVGTPDGLYTSHRFLL